MVPDLESGNMLAKQLEYLGGAQLAGIVLGARVPVILTSRADSAETRLTSCAVAVLLHYATHPVNAGGMIQRLRRDAQYQIPLARLEWAPSKRRPLFSTALREPFSLAKHPTCGESLALGSRPS